MQQYPSTPPSPDNLSTLGVQAQIDTELEQNRAAISAEVRDFANRNVSLIGRLFPNSMERLFRDQQLLAVRTELDFRHRMLDLYVESKLATMNEKYETMIRVVKVQFRQQFIQFVTERQEQLRRQVDERRRTYVRDDVEREKFYEEFKHLAAGAAYGRAIREECEQYFAWMGRLIQDFQNIVDEKIRSYKD